MSLFTKPIHQIKWDDVEAFCEQRIAENAVLDYKEDFPRELEKTLAAMANTLGGVVLIGIEEDSENKPLLPIKGIQFEKGLSERVMNIIFTNVTRPFMPEIQPAVDLTGQRVIVVVRIPESHQTPHALGANTRVYYRTGDRNQPETLASIDRIEWLIGGRKKSLQFRECLYRQAEVRLKSLWEASVGKGRDEGQAIQQVGGTLTMTLCPLYSRERFKPPPEMMEVFLASRVHDYYRNDHYFPIPSGTSKTRIVQDGIVSHLGGPTLYHTELNCFGLYFYKQSIVREDPKIGKFIRSTQIFARLDEFFDSAVRYYKQLGYWGALELQISLEGIQGCILFYEQDFLFAPRSDCPDVNVSFSAVASASSLREDKARLVLDTAQQLAWAFNYRLTAETLDKYYLAQKGESVLNAK